MHEKPRVTIFSEGDSARSFANKVLRETDAAIRVHAIGEGLPAGLTGEPRPDLIVLECGMSGKGVWNANVDLPPDIPIIAILPASLSHPEAFEGVQSQVMEGDAVGLRSAVRMALELRNARAALQRIASALAYRLEFETLLTDLSSRLVHTPSCEIDTALREAVSLVGRFTGVERCFLFELDEAETLATFAHEWCAAGLPSHKDLFPAVNVADFPWANQMFENLQHVYVPDVEDLPDAAEPEKSRYRSAGIRSILVVPLEMNRRVLGLLGLATVRATRSWVDEDIRLLEAVAQIIANAIDRRRKESALIRIEDRFSDFADLLPVAVGIYDGTRIVYANRGGEEITGFNREEILDKDLFFFLHEDDKDTVRIWLEQLTREGGQLSQELRFFNKRGQERFADLQCRTIDYEGKRAYLLVALDTTQRRQAEQALRESEERLRRVLENMPVMLDAYDEVGNVIVWNRECERVTGYSSEEIVGNPRALELLYPDAAYRQRMFDELSGRDTGFRDWEWQITCKNGAVRTISWANISSRFPIPGWAVWAVGMDVTERRKLEKQVLEISAREQRRIGQDLHDRLGQHLTGMGFKAQSLAQVLRKKAVPESETAATLVSLVSTALAMTRGLARGLHPVQVESNGLMTALEELSGQAQDVYGIPSRFVCEEPVLVDDNSTAMNLYRIAQEALNNAAKHGSPSSIEIRLSSENRGITLVIDDDGTGFANGPESGEGLGLSIMAYRARMIEGKLTIEKRPEGGTRVTCTANLGKHEADFAEKPSTGGIQ